MPTEDPIAKALNELRFEIGTANAQKSEEAEREEVQTVRRELTREEGQKIVDQAKTWEGTPYLSSGSGKDSVKGAQGKADCSGSTYYIYVDAGYPYGKDYMHTRAFQTYVQSEESSFIEIPDIQSAQPGDILFWPGHIAIYAEFPEEENRVTFGRKDNMWTARRPGKNYCSHPWETFRGGAVPKVYRYMIEEKKK
jgi:cell wall-associated NlpC family hydrolase